VLAVGDYEGNVVLWDAAQRREIARWKGHRSPVRALGFSPDGKNLATGGDDSVIQLWELGSRRRLMTFTGHQSSIWGLSFSPDGSTLASAGGDGVKLWNSTVMTGERELPQTITPLWFSPATAAALRHLPRAERSPPSVEPAADHRGNGHR